MRRLSLLAGALVVVLSATACFGSPPPPPDPHRDVVVFGDSNAWGIGCSLGDPGDLAATNEPFPCTPQSFSVENSTEGGCSIMGGVTLLYDRVAIPPSCSDWPSKWAGILDETTPKLVILNTGGWEIVDRWLNFPNGCNPGNAYDCSAPDLQWGDPNNFGPAAAQYRSQLLSAISLFRSRGAKVLVVNSPYYAPTEPQVPGVPVWYERYPNDGGSGAQGVADWVAPNTNLQYRPSKLKTDEFDTTLKAALDANYANDQNVKFFDLWSIVSPNGEYSDYVNGILVRGPDHGHFNYDGYRYVIMPALLPVIQNMLA